jgi:hypothetical protein
MAILSGLSLLTFLVAHAVEGEKELGLGMNVKRQWYELWILLITRFIGSMGMSCVD